MAKFFFFFGLIRAEKGKAANNIDFGWRHALCLEAANFPNAINGVEGKISGILYPGEKYYQQVIHRFVVAK